MRSKGLLIGVLIAIVAFSATVLGFEAYFSDASGNRISEIWEGRTVHIAVEDPFKVACGIDAFDANVLIFDYKTGAYREIEATFIERGYAKGIFVWDQGAIPVGDRLNWQPISYQYPYRLADRDLRETLAIGYEHVTDNYTGGPGIDGRWWNEGNWEYVDADVGPVAGGALGGAPSFGAGNNTGVAQRFQFVDPQFELAEIGRFENQDTLVLLVQDKLDGFWGAGQLKIKRTEAQITTSITEVYYGCSDIIVRIEDRDESLSSDRSEFVPFFAIVNPGSFQLEAEPVDDDDDLPLPPPPPDNGDPDDPPPPPPPPPTGTSTAAVPQQITEGTRGVLVNSLCALFRTGGVDPTRIDDEGYATVLDDPIRWYNIYDMRYIQYPYDADADTTRPDGWSWAPPPDPHPDTGNVDRSLINFDPVALRDGDDATSNIERPAGVGRVTFYAEETGPNTGVFEFNFGSLDQLQKRLGFGRFPAGTTIAFYYVDPNDFSDMVVTTIEVASPYTRSNVRITDAFGNKVNQVRLGEDGLYFRVEDSKMTTDDCLQEWVLVHVCDIHGEDDSEFYKLDEVSSAAGVFSAAGAMRLDPVWDAVGGYQLVLNDGRFQAFNADTIFVRYNAVLHNPDHVERLGVGTHTNWSEYPPRIVTEWDGEDLPYYPWDVSFDTVKVYDYQVFDGTRTTMRFLDGRFQPVTTYRPGDQIYLEVTDLDQNEDSRIAERISGRWDRLNDSSPIWGSGVLAEFLHFDEDAKAAKVFLFNPRTGNVKAVDLMETGPNTGVFKSTTGITVGDLGGREADLIVAFYQDPSNHHDIATISTRVKGGPITPPDPASVSFDRTQYQRGDTGTITVTEPQFAGQPEIAGADVLVLRDKDGNVVQSWDAIPVMAGETNRFRVTFTVPEDVPTGTIRAVYTHPTDEARTAEATAQVVVRDLEDVTGIDIDPEFLATEATFRIQAVPVGAVADTITITFYDLTGRKVGEVTGNNTDSVIWDGANLRSTAAIYVAVVEAEGKDPWVFKGPVYIRR